MMKIALDISQIVYETGVSRYTKELVRHLLKIDRENYYLLFAGVWRERDKIDAFLQQLREGEAVFEQKVITLPPKVASLVFNQLRLPIDVFIGKVDVFHASNWTTPKTQACLVTTVHDLTPALFPEAFPKSIVDNFRVNLELVRQNAAAVLVDCETTKKDLIAKSDILADKVTTVYLAAGEDFQPVKEKQKLEMVKEKYGIRKKFVLSVGTKEPRKNLARLIEAFNSWEGSKDYQLVLVGKHGWGEEAKVGNKKQGVKIVETGFVTDEDLSALYSAAEVFVYPSLYEGFGLPVLEAMQCGCPVITSDLSATAEIAAEAALLIEPTNVSALTRALKQVVSDGKLRDTLVIEGIKRARQFSWEKTAAETLAIYQKVYGNVMDS